VVGDTPDKGRRHVDAHGGDLLGPRFVSGQVLGKAGDGRGAFFTRWRAPNRIRRSSMQSTQTQAH
jgi:hypothetical protein